MIVCFFFCPSISLPPFSVLFPVILCSSPSASTNLSSSGTTVVSSPSPPLVASLHPPPFPVLGDCFSLVFCLGICQGGLPHLKFGCRGRFFLFLSSGSPQAWSPFSLFPCVHKGDSSVRRGPLIRLFSPSTSPPQIVPLAGFLVAPLSFVNTNTSCVQTALSSDRLCAMMPLRFPPPAPPSNCSPQIGRVDIPPLALPSTPPPPLFVCLSPVFPLLVF